MTFVRFPSVSQTSGPISGFGPIDPSEVYNLAGKHPGGNQDPCEGTGFDLENLIDTPVVMAGDVDLNDIHFVKVIDVIGNGSTLDFLGNPIYDPYPTGFDSSGCDLQAVGVINQLDCTDGDEDGYNIEGGPCGPVDCNDIDATINPGVEEGPAGEAVCSDTEDNDCDGASDGADSGCIQGGGWRAAAQAEAAALRSANHNQSQCINLVLMIIVP